MPAALNMDSLVDQVIPLGGDQADHSVDSTAPVAGALPRQVRGLMMLWQDGTVPARQWGHSVFAQIGLQLRFSRVCSPPEQISLITLSSLSRTGAIFRLFLNCPASANAVLGPNFD